MNTETGNKLIAEFMGAVWIEDDYGNWGYKSELFPAYFKMYVPAALQYHTSWDWLHPVVDKIAEFAPNDYTAAKANVCLRSISSKIEDVWQAVVEFIEWLNKSEKVKSE